METLDEKKKMITEPLISTPKGGFRTLPFIIVNEAFEKVATYGLSANMILYFVREYGMESTKGTNILYFWTAATYFLPILGAAIADCYVGRYRMIGFGCFASFLGMLILWLTALLPQARPENPCYQTDNTNCQSPTTPQLTLLYSSLSLMSIGAGGIRSSSLAFGVDQLTAIDNNNLNNVGILERFFSWYYVASAVSVVVALTCIVYIQEKLGWEIGFAIPVLLMFLSAFSFFLASPFYVKKKAKTSLLTGLAQVVVASYRNRHFLLSSQSTDHDDIMYHHKKGSTLEVPSEKLRFLNKACVITNPQQDLTPEGRASNPWRLCMVDQVEELKAVIKVIPIWSTGVLMSINISQMTIPTLQAASMDRHVNSKFEIPAGSFSMFMVISLSLWIALYDRVILPLASKIMKKPTHFGVKQRMGIGIIMSCMSMAAAAIVESFRRETAIQQGISYDPQAVVNMSAMWLVPQHCLNGLAEAFNALAQNQFYYSELPKSMSSIASTITGVGLSMANLAASFLLTVTDDLTKRGGHESWVSSNINKAHFDYYYGILAFVSLVNFVYFIGCSRAYGTTCEEGGRVLNEEDQIRDE